MVQTAELSAFTSLKDYQRCENIPTFVNICTSGDGALIALDTDGLCWRMLNPADLVQMGLNPAGAGWHQLEYGSIFYSCVTKVKP